MPFIHSIVARAFLAAASVLFFVASASVVPARAADMILDLRDRSGIAQIVLDKELTPEGHAKGEQVRPEYVVAAVGKVSLRDPDAINPKMPTGEIEIEATQLLVLNDTHPATPSRPPAPLPNA